MKVLVLGAAGMAGHTICLHFLEAGHDIVALARRKIGFAPSIIADASDFSSLKNIVIEGNYNAVINCIGLLNQDAEDQKAAAVAMNSYLPHFLSELTSDLSTRIIHMSTDCVFSGNSGGYSEESFCDGHTFYDRSKALGELSNNKDLTIRTSIIGPDINENGIGLFNWFMKQNQPIEGYERAIWTGVTTLTLAKAMERALTINLSGLYHLVNNEKINKFELLKLFNEVFKGNQLKITASRRIEVDKSLIDTRKDFAFEVPSYKRMIIEMYDWVLGHAAIYPHYDLKEAKL